MNKLGFLLGLVGLAVVTLGPAVYNHGNFAEMILAFLLSVSSFLFISYYGQLTDSIMDLFVRSFIPSVFSAVIAGVGCILTGINGESAWLETGLCFSTGIWIFTGTIWICNSFVPEYFKPFNRASAFLIFLLMVNAIAAAIWIFPMSRTAIYWMLISGVVLILQHQLRYYVRRSWGTAVRSQRVNLSITMFAFFFAFIFGLILWPWGLFLFLGGACQLVCLILFFEKWLSNPIIPPVLGSEEEGS